MENSKEIIEAQLCAYIDGELSPTEQVEIERHLAGNPQHRALIDDLRQMRGLLQGLPRAKAPGELNENLTGSLERSALLDPSEGEEAAVVGRINRWPQWTAVAAVLILAVGLAIVVYSMLPPRANNTVVVINEPRPGGRPTTDTLAQKEGDLADGAGERAKVLSSLGKEPVPEKSKGTESELLGGRSLEKQMNDAMLRANIVNGNDVEYARRRLAMDTGALSTAYCMFVSAENATSANEQMTAYFKSNGIVYAVNDTKNLDQVALGGPRDLETYGVKAKGAYDNFGGANAARGAGGGGGGFGGGSGLGGARGGGVDKAAPDNKTVESVKEPGNAGPPKPEAKPNQTTGANVAENVDAAKLDRTFAAPKRAATDPAAAKGLEEDEHVAQGSVRANQSGAREEMKKDVTSSLTENPAPVALKPEDANNETLSILPNAQVKFGEQVIVARMSRKQLGELQTRLSSQGQKSQITLAAMGRPLAGQQQGQWGADKPEGSELRIAPTPAPTSAALDMAVEKRADVDRAGGVPATTSPASPTSQPAKDGVVQAKKAEALTLKAPVDELLDVLIVVQGGEAAQVKEAAAKPAAQSDDTKPANDAKPGK